MDTLKTKLRNELEAYKVLLRSVPGGMVGFFVLTCVLMNLFANKSIDTGLEWLPLDGGILLSWAAFLTSDMIVKRFGPKAAIRMTIFGLFCNLLVAGMLALVGALPGLWGEFFTFELDEVNQALNNTFMGTWYILLGSSVAFLVSGIANALINHALGKLFHNHESFTEYTVRSYVSTFLGQFIDNITFCSIVSMNFFGWTFSQALMCAATGAVVELLCEVVFSPLGYKICKKWKKENVGLEYIEKYEPEMISVASEAQG